MNQTVIVTDDGARRDLTLAHPERGNCLSENMVARLSEELDKAERDGVRLLTFRGEGRHFCTGFDLSDLETVTDAQLLARFISIELLLAKIWSAPFDTAAAAQGRVIGAGADLFACCSFRVATPETSFAFPGAGFGLILGTRRLGERIGADRAADLIRTGRQMKFNEALDAGLVTQAASVEDQPSLLKELCTQSSRLDPVTVARFRSQLTNDRSALDGDLAALVRSAAKPGLCERIRAYRTKSLSR